MTVCHCGRRQVPPVSRLPSSVRQKKDKGKKKQRINALVKWRETKVEMKGGRKGEAVEEEG